VIGRMSAFVMMLEKALRGHVATRMGPRQKGVRSKEEQQGHPKRVSAGLEPGVNG
jgi:hypothetical protein